MKHLDIILKKMCEAVGQEHKGFDFKDDAWFHKNEWTQQQEDEFVEWLSDYFKDIEARRELASFPSWGSKKHRDKLAREFVFCYGWRVKNNICLDELID